MALSAREPEIHICLSLFSSISSASDTGRTRILTRKLFYEKVGRHFQVTLVQVMLPSSEAELLNSSFASSRISPSWVWDFCRSRATIEVVEKLTSSKLHFSCNRTNCYSLNMWYLLVGAFWNHHEGYKPPPLQRNERNRIKGPERHRNHCCQMFWNEWCPGDNCQLCTWALPHLP